MNTNGAAIAAIVIPIVAYIGLVILSLVIFYWLVKKAIRTAMADHYKTVRIFEATGDWIVGPFGKGAPPVEPNPRVE